MREIFGIIVWIIKIILSPILIGMGLIAGFIEFVVSLFGWYVIISVILIILVIKFLKS